MKEAYVGVRVALWIYGESGTGKTRYAVGNYPKAYRKDHTKWWDGYNGESEVILDDLGKDHGYIGHYLKLWADRYAINGETKGGKLPL